MEVSLTIFFALTFLVLGWNAVLLWYLWKMFRRANERAKASRTHHARLIATLQTSVRTAERATERMATVSGQIRAAVSELDDGLARADNWARYGLAKLDFNAHRASDKLRARTRTLGGRVGEPLYRTAAAIHGVKAVLDMIVELSGSKEGRLKRATRVLGPLDAAATVVQAFTALGSLFSRRNLTDDIAPGRIPADTTRQRPLSDA